MKMLKRRILTIFILSMVLFVMATPAHAMPKLVLDIVSNGDFLAKLEGFDDYMLCDVEKISQDRLGLVLLSAVGFERHIVFDVSSHKILYDDSFIPARALREKMASASIRVVEAKRLAKLALLREESK